MSEEDLHERALALEKQIRRFVIAVNNGSIDGGFESTHRLTNPPEDIYERIGNIEKSVLGFGLVGGNGLAAAGSLQDGYFIFQN